MKLTATVVSGIAAGILDLAGAIFVYELLLNASAAGRILQSVAGGIYGRETYEGGVNTAVAGLLLHFLIALIFAAVYVYIFRNISRRITTNIVLTGLVYGCLVWVLMNYAVMPLSAYGHATKFSTAKGMAISAGLIILCAGIPIVFISEKILKKKTPAI